MKSADITEHITDSLKAHEYTPTIRLRYSPAKEPTPVKCKHEWPEGPNGTDMDGSCVKCGMSFVRYIHCECP